MRRDWDLVRRILLALEESEGGNLTPDRVTGFDQDTVCYHMEIMRQAGLIDARVIQGACVALSLTWKGHEFLDGIRKDMVWNKVKARAREAGIGLTTDVVVAPAKKVMEGILL